MDLRFLRVLFGDDHWKYNCRCDGMVDVVDSKSTAGDSVPVRVRSPAPKKQIPIGVSAFLLFCWGCCCGRCCCLCGGGGFQLFILVAHTQATLEIIPVQFTGSIGNAFAVAVHKEGGGHRQYLKIRGGRIVLIIVHREGIASVSDQLICLPRTTASASPVK